MSRYDDIMANAGVSIDVILDEAMKSMPDMEDLKEEGKYNLSSGKLYLTNSDKGKGKAFDNIEYLEYVFESNSMLRFPNIFRFDSDSEYAYFAEMFGTSLTFIKQ